MEVPAPFAGVVKELKVNVGDKVKTGSLIMIFKVEGAAACGSSCETGSGSAGTGSKS